MGPGWLGAAIVLNRYRRHEVFARYLIATLGTDPQTKPTLADFRNASILQVGGSGSLSGRRCIHAVSTSRQHLQRMQVGVVGRLSIAVEAVAAEFPTVHFGETDFSNCASADLSLLDVAVRPNDPLARYLA